MNKQAKMKILVAKQKQLDARTEHVKMKKDIVQAAIDELNSDGND